MPDGFHGAAHIEPTRGKIIDMTESQKEYEGSSDGGSEDKKNHKNPSPSPTIPRNLINRSSDFTSFFIGSYLRETSNEHAKHLLKTIDLF